jgi:hypothetical protein
MALHNAVLQGCSGIDFNDRMEKDDVFRRKTSPGRPSSGIKHIVDLK